LGLKLQYTYSVSQDISLATIVKNIVIPNNPLVTKALSTRVGTSEAIRLLSTKLNHNYSISSKFNYVPSSTKFTLRQGNTALPNLPFPPAPPANLSTIHSRLRGPFNVDKPCKFYLI